MDRATRAALIDQQTSEMFDLQDDDGHIVFELEADCTIPAEYVIMCHFLGEILPDREARLAEYLRGVSEPGWIVAIVPRGRWQRFGDGQGVLGVEVDGRADRCAAHDRRT